MNYQELHGCTIRNGFNKFNEENPHIYKEFEKQAFIAIDKGLKKMSSKLIINFIRWNEFLRTTDQNFKINDAYQSYYARHFIELHPEYKDYFDFRKLRNEEKGQYMTIGENCKLSFL